MRLPWLIVVMALGGGHLAAAEAKKGRVVVSDTSVEILGPVTFADGKATLMASSFPVLDAVAATMKNNPEIQLVEVQSHSDERGDDKKNLTLTQARADVVMKYLIAAGVEGSRLTAQGYGATQPLDRGHNEAAWAKNRRVAFLILKRAG